MEKIISVWDFSLAKNVELLIYPMFHASFQAQSTVSMTSSHV